MFLCMNTGSAHAMVCVGGVKGQTQVSIITIHLVWDRDFLLLDGAEARLASLWALGNSNASASWLILEALGLQVCTGTATPSFIEHLGIRAYILTLAEQAFTHKAIFPDPKAKYWKVLSHI